MRWLELGINECGADHQTDVCSVMSTLKDYCSQVIICALVTHLAVKEYLEFPCTWSDAAMVRLR